MKKLQLPDLLERDALSFLFYQVPQILVDDEAFSSLDGWAIILYSLMLNRLGLSVKNSENFKDENGRLYIIFTIEEVMRRCKCGKNVAIKLMKQLEEVGLIEKKIQGLGRPALIYVKNFAYYKSEKTESENTNNTEEFKKQTSDVYKINSRSLKNKPRKVYKVNRSNINHSKTNHSNIESINQGRANPESFDNPPTTEKEETTRYDTIDNNEKEEVINNTTMADNSDALINILKSDDIPKTVADNISLDELIADDSDKKDKITELYNIVCDVLNNNKSPTIRINKQPVPIATVKCHFAQLNKSHILYVLHCLEKNAHNIKTNSKAYITTSLFHSIRTIDSYKSYNDSVFASAKDTHENQSSFDIQKFFERAVNKSYINIYDDISDFSFQSV